MRIERPCCDDLGRQLRLRQRRAVLHVDRVDVGIGAERESDVERVGAVGAAGRLVVDRVVDAVDLRLDRLRDGGLDEFGVGAGIVRRQRHLRRHDVGKLRDGNGEDRQQARERDDDGDDEGEARTVDEDRGDHLAAPASPVTSLALTTWPGRTFWMPSTITFSPACSPEAMAISVLTASAVVTRRTCTFLSSSTIST